MRTKKKKRVGVKVEEIGAAAVCIYMYLYMANLRIHCRRRRAACKATVCIYAKYAITHLNASIIQQLIDASFHRADRF